MFQAYNESKTNGMGGTGLYSGTVNSGVNSWALYIIQVYRSDNVVTIQS